MKDLTKKIINNGNYDIAYYHCNKFSSIDIMLNFQMEASKQKYINVRTLFEYMFSNSKKYNSIESFNKKVKELYNINFYKVVMVLGDKLSISVKINIINPSFIGEDYFKDAIDFAKEVIYNPNFKNKMPDKNILSRKIKERKEACKNNLTNPDYKAYYNFTKNWGGNTHEMDELYASKREIDTLYKNASKELYETYKKLLNSFVSMEIMGDLDKEEIELIKETFKFDKVKKLDSNYYIPYSFETYDRVTKDKNVSESVYIELFEIKNYDYKEKYKYLLIERFLNYTVGRLLHQKLRDELGIVYNSSASFNDIYGFLMIVSNINRKNKNKCKKGIEDVINMLKDEKLINKLLKEALEMEEEKYYLSDEEYYAHLTYIREVSLKENLTMEELLNSIRKSTSKDILKAVNNLERRSSYFYEGTKEESNI